MNENVFRTRKPTARQLEILKLRALGQSTYQVADKLRISENTLKNHMTHLFERTGVTTVSQAVALALVSGWITIAPDEMKLGATDDKIIRIDPTRWGNKKREPMAIRQVRIARTK